MSGKTTKIALIQMDCVLHEVERNVKKTLAYIEEAAAKGADLICLPEYFDTGYCCEKSKEILINARYLDDKDHHSLNLVKEAAKNFKVHIIAPMAMKIAPGIYENAAIMIDDEGKVLGSYSKTHPVAEERLCVSKGKSNPVFKTKLGNIGILICYDACFPETAAILAEKGAELIVVVAAWRKGDNLKEWWDVNIACRAIDNVVFVAAVNRIGPANDKREFLGRSAVIDPKGYVVSGKVDEKERLIFSEIDLDDVRECRFNNSVLLDRNLNEYYILNRLCESL